MILIWLLVGLKRFLFISFAFSSLETTMIITKTLHNVEVAERTSVMLMKMG